MRAPIDQSPLSWLTLPLVISFEIARSFALEKARVILISRKEDQGHAAVQKIKEEAGADARVEWISCDLGNLGEVKEVFGSLREREQRLDLVGVSALQ